MLSRALNLATVTVLIGCFAAEPARAQAQNLEAGKSPSQIFAGTCTACHKSPRGLLKTVAAGSLPGFLRQHYTTSGEMASLLSAFLVSNGASDTRYAGTQAKLPKDAKLDARPAGASVDQLDRFGHRLRPAAAGQQELAQPDSEPASKPDGAAAASQGESGHPSRLAKRQPRPVEGIEVAKPDGQVPALTTTDRGPEGAKSSKQRVGKRGRPGEEPRIDGHEPARVEPAREDAPKSETAKVDSAQPDAAKPAAGESTSGPTGIELSKDAPGGDGQALRPDPVPPVTPAPAVPPVSVANSVSAADGVTEPSAKPVPPASAAVTASMPPPAAPAGPPSPPISQ